MFITRFASTLKTSTDLVIEGDLTRNHEGHDAGGGPVREVRRADRDDGVQN